MSNYQWKAEYSVKVAGIDSQHKKLIQLLDSLNTAMTEGRGKQVLDQVLSELFTYAENHFQTEEQYFEKYAYPDAAQHVMQHNDFRKKVSELKTKFDSGNLLVTVELLNYLYDWVGQHILKTDMKYSDFLNSKGVS